MRALALILGWLILAIVYLPCLVVGWVSLLLERLLMLARRLIAWGGQ